MVEMVVVMGIRVVVVEVGVVAMVGACCIGARVIVVVIVIGVIVSQVGVVAVVGACCIGARVWVRV